MRALTKRREGRRSFHQNRVREERRSELSVVRRLSWQIRSCLAVARRRRILPAIRETLKLNDTRCRLVHHMCKVVEANRVRMEVAAQPTEETVGKDVDKGSFSLAWTHLWISGTSFRETTLMRATANEQLAGFPKREGLKSEFLERGIEDEELTVKVLVVLQLLNQGLHLEGSRVENGVCGTARVPSFRIECAGFAFTSNAKN